VRPAQDLDDIGSHRPFEIEDDAVARAIDQFDDRAGLLVLIGKAGGHQQRLSLGARRALHAVDHVGEIRRPHVDHYRT
jgi:hypothetical protein